MILGFLKKYYEKIILAVFLLVFIVSLILQCFFHFLIPTTKNKLTVIYLIVLALFLIGDQALSK